MKIDFNSYGTTVYKYYNNSELSSISAYANYPKGKAGVTGAIDIFYETDFKATYIRGGINGKTAQIDLEILTVILYELKQKRNFKKLEFTGHYFEATAEEVMKLILQMEKDNQ